LRLLIRLMVIISAEQIPQRFRYTDKGFAAPAQFGNRSIQFCHFAHCHALLRPVFPASPD
jgi:hypothetical protein